MRTQCEHVGLEFLESAPYRFRASEIVRATPEQIFASFEDAEAWKRWVTAITDVEWTSPFPLEVGSTRAVTMTGGVIGYEEFIAWERGRRMAFRFNEVSHPVLRAFAEDYHVVDLRDGTCRVNWTLAMDPIGPGAKSMPLAKPMVGAAIKWMLRRFKADTERTNGTSTRK
jgi:hypothetical protein